MEGAVLVMLQLVLVPVAVVVVRALSALMVQHLQAMLLATVEMALHHLSPVLL
jgi:hypothetical protein